MSESLHIGSSPDNEPIADVLRPDFSRRSESDEYIKPEELTNEEIVDQFLAQMTHPSAHRQSSELGEYLQSILGGRNSSTIPESENVWQGKIKDIMIDIDDLHDDELSQLLASDEVLRRLYDTLKFTRDRAKELKEERKALLLLRELRAGIIMGNIATTEFHEQRWHGLIGRLAK